MVLDKQKIENRIKKEIRCFTCKHCLRNGEKQKTVFCGTNYTIFEHGKCLNDEYYGKIIQKGYLTGKDCKFYEEGEPQLNIRHLKWYEGV